MVCGAPSYLAKHGTPKKPTDLSGHNCVRLQVRRRPAGPTNWLLGSSKVATSVRGNFLANDITTLVMAAVHGQGLVFAPLPFVLPLFRSGALVPLLPDWISRPAHLFFHYPNRKHLPVRVRGFVNFMLEKLRRNPDLVSDPRALVAPHLPGR